MTYTDRRRLFWVFSVLFAALALPIIWYATGWRLASDFTFKRTGGLFVSADKSEVEIFINDELEKRTNLLQSGIFVQGLAPGKISVIAAREDYWPWAKELEIKESIVTEARAFLVPKEPKGEVLLQGKYKNIYSTADPELLILESEKNGRKIYDYYSPFDKKFVMDISLKPDFFIARAADVIDARKKVRVWIADDKLRVLAEWLDESPLPYFFTARGEILIFNAKSKIRVISFYPGRRDVILVAVENGIFAIELDGRGMRNFQPVYKGKNPTFAVLEGLVYILDDDRLFEVRI